MSKEDAKHISYFYSGEVIEVIDYEDSNWKNQFESMPEEQWTAITKLDFQPQIETPALDTEIEKDIIYNFVNSDITGLELDEDFVIVDKFLGQYNQFYAVIMKVTNIATESLPQIFIVNDIVFETESAYPILLFYYNVAQDEEELSSEQINTLKQDYIQQYGEETEILKYYGTYNGSIVVRVERDGDEEQTIVEIGGVKFNFSDANFPLVWKEGQFFELSDAFAQELLTTENLVKIAQKVILKR